MKLTVLGSGTSFGIPQVGCSCQVCTSDDPRDRRTRTGAVIETAESAILIDTPPELRLQLVRSGISAVDAVLYTHEHADHTAGIDDLRIFTIKRRASLPVYGPAETIAVLEARFGYIFDDAVKAYRGTSKPELVPHAVEPGTPLEVAGQQVLPLEFEHGYSKVFGYRVGPVAYVTDVKSIPEASRDALRGVEVLVLSALWWRSHPTHLSIAEAVEVAQSIGARQTFLTHLTHETGHAELERQLPAAVKPAYDGLTVEVD